MHFSEFSAYHENLVVCENAKKFNSKTNVLNTTYVEEHQPIVMEKDEFKQRDV